MLADQDLAIALLNQETGIRGYALTGRDEFLEPYRDGSRREAAGPRRAARRTSGPTAQAAQADAVERAAQAWRSGYAEPVIAAVRGVRRPGPGPRQGPVRRAAGAR